ncbi:MAG: hypothetical protein EZS28_023882 [Streblomastix strix]|uniref:Uncharacterized protein n=1 Tax=Streblomastix strix TaxID=222440 RepID=A0A5J4VDN0_9EUKA|nr:MAG: hypothetical protein EZS28_023882 [Streblomastix strix]
MVILDAVIQDINEAFLGVVIRDILFLDEVIQDVHIQILEVRYKFQMELKPKEAFITMMMLRGFHDQLNKL